MTSVAVFAPTLAAVRDAREFIVDACRGFGLDEDRTLAAKLLTSELVANALLVSNGDVEIDVACSPDRLEVGVTRQSTSNDTPALPPDPDRLDGMGLELVQQLADDHGVHPKPQDPGSTHHRAWFQLKVTGEHIVDITVRD